MAIAIALVEPQYEVNVGHIARLMKNFGLQKMYLIDPHFNEEEAIRFSTHGKEILASAQLTSITKLRKKFDVIVGTTAIPATSRLNVFRESISPERFAQIVKSSSHEKDFCILLGRESSGLNNEELRKCEIVISIDTKTAYRTMNIAHALAIILYELSKTNQSAMFNRNTKPKQLASREEIALLARYVDKVATVSRYDKHKQPLLNAAFKSILGRSNPTSKEVMLLVSLFRKSMTVMGGGDRLKKI